VSGGLIMKIRKGRGDSCQLETIRAPGGPFIQKKLRKVGGKSDGEKGGWGKYSMKKDLGSLKPCYFKERITKKKEVGKKEDM